MLATVRGIFQEGKINHKKDGSQDPYILIYADEEITRINGVDYSGLTPGTFLEIPCSIRVGQYGLYVKAIVDEEKPEPAPNPTPVFIPQLPKNEVKK